ncbi:MAG: aldo/keto reductase [Flavobacteriaceae bacterium]|nr:aldo/keto reductase [Flavobacteriaceae bacterium]
MQTHFSKLIQGCMTWGAWGKQHSKNEMIELMLHDIECGITSFDHADIYGDYTTESDFGKAFAESGVKREQIQIISKCGIQYVGNTRANEIKHYQYDANYIIWSAEKSIKDLQCNYLDLLLLHRPSPLMHPDEIAKAIEKLTNDGKIKAFGVSNFTPSQTELINSKNSIEYNQIEFSLTAHQAMFDGTLDTMMLKNITPMCWSPLGTVFKERNDQIHRIHTTLEALSEKYNASKDQLLLAWIMKHPSNIHPVIGTTHKERIKNAMEATKIELSDIDWFQLLVASQGHKVP